MAEAQSTPADGAAEEDPEARFFRSLIAVLKENREVLPRLPEIMECQIVNENQAPTLIERRKLEKSSYIHSLKAEIQKKEKEISKKEKEISEIVKEKEEKILSLETELEEKEKEILKKEKELAKKDKEISETVKQNEKKILSLETELQKKEKEISKREKELAKKDKEISETVKQNEEKILSLKTELQKKENDISNKEEEVAKRDHEISEIMKKNEENALQMKVELKAARSKMDNYKSRLASLSEQRVKQDQRLVEDTLSSNRQSELEKDFSSFFDHDRMDACEKIQCEYLHTEDEYIYIYYPRLACIILETAYERVKEVKESAIDLFKELTKQMVDCAAVMGKYYSATRVAHNKNEINSDNCKVPINVAIWGDGSEYPKDAMDGMTLSLKEAAQNCDLDPLMKDVFDKVVLKWETWCQEDSSCMFSPAYHLLQGLDKYTKACIRLTWRMVTQVPPMKLEYGCPKFNKDVHKRIGYHPILKVSANTHPSTQQDQEEEIACYLWPGLQDGGGRLIRAGEVFCKYKETEEQTARFQ